MQDTRDRVCYQRSCVPAADESLVPIARLGDGAVFSTPPQSRPESQPDPAGKVNQLFGCFAEAEIAAPTPQIVDLGEPQAAADDEISMVDLLAWRRELCGWRVGKPR